MIDTLERWYQWYPKTVSRELPVPQRTLAEAWSMRVSEAPEATALRYFDAEYTAREVDAAASAIAVGLRRLGVRRGDVVGIQLQNVPQFVLVELALWQIGAVALVLNPMYKQRELATIVADARPVGLVGAEGEIEAAASMLGDLFSGWVLTTREYDASAHGPRMPDELGRPVAGDLPETDLHTLLARHHGETPGQVELSPDAPALLTYTSGTTGEPKGAVASHANLLATAESTRQWLDLRPGERVLAIAPLFHITGAVAVAVTALVSGAELVFIGRLTPERFLQAVVNYRIQHLCGSITAYNSLLDLPAGNADSFQSLRTVFSGGAPVPPQTVARFQARFGHYIRNIYGMTETASACIAVPLGHEAPVEPSTGTLAIGVPMPGVRVRVRGSDGSVAAPGVQGELEISGPSVTREYLNKPDATAETIVDGWLRTGDVAILDTAGWVYLVDRMKDQINVSGYKVWPREVEDVLYEHRAVREAAVVGRPHPYSGEEVVAYVSLRTGGVATGEEIRAHVKARLAAYKAPKTVVILSELPKTATGKIQRRALRDSSTDPQ